MFEKSRFSKNVAAGIVFIVIASFFFYHTLGLSPQNSAFPRALCALLFILGVTTLIQGIRTRSMIRKDKPINYVRIFAVLATMAIYLSSLEKVGFILCTTILVPVIAFLLGYRKILPTLLGAIAFSILIFILFSRYLSIPLPRGVLSFFQ